MRVFVRTNLDPLLQYGSRLNRALDVAVRATAFRIERDWKLLVPVDTGAYRASIYTVTSRGSDRQATNAAAQATKRRPGVKINSIGTVQSGLIEAYVVAGVEYAKVVNNTHPTNRFCMERAARKNERRFRVEVGKAIRKAGRP